MAGRVRAHTSLGFSEDRDSTPQSKTSGWREARDQAGGAAGRLQSQSVLGHAAQPAASFGFESRKQNLDPRKRKDLMSLPRERKDPPRKGTKDGQLTFKQRQQQREERNKNHYKIPDAVDKIAAEKLISGNPLLNLENSLTNQKSDYKVKDLSSLSLTDLCMLRIAFEKADDDNSGELDEIEFVNAFLPVLETDAGDVSLLFMKIDANCDGTVSWEEFLSYILSQDEGALVIARESARQLFDYPAMADTVSQLSGHRDAAGGLILLEEADRYVSYSRKGEILVWRPDAIEGLKVQNPKEFNTELPFITGMVHIKRRSHSDRLALCSADKQLIFVDLMRDTCKLSGKIKVEHSPLAMCVVIEEDDHGVEKDRMLAFGDDAGCIHLYDLTTLTTMAERNLMSSTYASTAKDSHRKMWQAHEKNGWINKMEYIPDIRALASCASDGQIVLSDVIKGAPKVDGLRHRGEVHDFCWLHKVQLLASCGLERHINLWQIPIKTPVYQLDGHPASLQQVVAAAGQLISLDSSKTVIVWDIKEMSPIQRLEAMKVHQDYPVGRIIYDEKRKSIVTLARKMLLWHMTERKVPNGHTQPVTCAIYNATFELVVSADESSLVRVWDLNTGRAILRFSNAHVNADGEPVKVSAMMFDRTHRRLLSGAHNGSVKVWNFSTGQCLEELSGFGDGEVSSMATMHLKPYEYFVAAGWNHKVTFWLDSQAQCNPRPPPGTSSGTTAADLQMEGHLDDILCMACRNAGQLLVTGAFDGDVVLWNTESGHPRTRLILPGILAMRGDQKPIEALALLPCSHAGSGGAGRLGAEDVVLAITAGGDGVIRFWSTNAAAELLLEFEVPDSAEGGLSGLSLCDKNKVMVAADGHGWVMVYDLVATARSAADSLSPICKPLQPPALRGRFRAHQGPISALHYIARRRLVLTASQDCTLCLWKLDGTKMGTFGEPAGWLLRRDGERFETKQQEEAVFGEGEGEGKEQEEGKRGREKKMVGAKLHIAERLKREGAARASPAPPVAGTSFFMTQTDGASQPVSAEQSGEVSEEISEEEELEGVSRVASASEEGDSASEVEEGPDDDDGFGELGMREGAGRKESLLLRMDINEIVNRGLAMRERGEKFFEAGSREVSAYQRMIVRDLQPYTLPDAIARRLKGGRKARQADSREAPAADEPPKALYSVDSKTPTM